MVDDLDSVIHAGRRALRRRNVVATIAGTAGTAALTAAVVVPIVVEQSGGSSGPSVTIESHPTPVAHGPRCVTFWSKATGQGNAGDRRNISAALKQAQLRLPDVYSITGHRRGDLYGVTACARPGAKGSGAPRPAMTPTTPAAPRYHYSESPQAISTRLGNDLTDKVQALGFSIVYTRPFAQESSTLAGGHPTYYAGNVDVTLRKGPADVGVQVTHEVIAQVPFTGGCTPPRCRQTTLPDGSVVQTSRISAGSGGATVIAVEVHRPNGLVVEAQMSNYAFGPEATRARSALPLTISQLTTLAEDSDFSF
jgi:hypothetical protein